MEDPAAVLAQPQQGAIRAAEHRLWKDTRKVRSGDVAWLKKRCLKIGDCVLMIISEHGEFMNRMICDEMRSWGKVFSNTFLISDLQTNINKMFEIIGFFFDFGCFEVPFLAKYVNGTATWFPCLSFFQCIFTCFLSESIDPRFLLSVHSVGLQIPWPAWTSTER